MVIEMRVGVITYSDSAHAHSQHMCMHTIIICDFISHGAHPQHKWTYE